MSSKETKPRISKHMETRHPGLLPETFKLPRRKRGGLHEFSGRSPIFHQPQNMLERSPMFHQPHILFGRSLIFHPPTFWGAAPFSEFRGSMAHGSQAWPDGVTRASPPQRPVSLHAEASADEATGGAGRGGGDAVEGQSSPIFKEMNKPREQITS